MEKNSESIILNKATELFSAKGYDGVGVQEICTESKITKPTLYYYFQSKTGLLSAIIKEKGNLLYETLEKAAEYKHDFMLSLSTILKSTVEFAKENPAFFRLHCALKVSSPESEAGKLYAPFAQTLQKIFLEFFQKSVNEIGNMKGKEELFSRIFLQTVEAFSLDIIQGRLEFSEHVCFSIIHSFAYGVVTG